MVHEFFSVAELGGYYLRRQCYFSTVTEPSPESRQHWGFTFVRRGFTFVQGELDIQI